MRVCSVCVHVWCVCVCVCVQKIEQRVSKKYFVLQFIHSVVYWCIPLRLSRYDTILLLDHQYASLSLSLLQFYHLWEEALGPYGYSWLDQTTYTDIRTLHMEIHMYNSSTLDPASKTAHFSDDDEWRKSH